MREKSIFVQYPPLLNMSIHTITIPMKSKSLPCVLVIGRPNVGKSTFINKMIHQNKAITLDQPGVTRDITSHLTDWNGKSFWLLDSGGIFLSTRLGEWMQEKIEKIVLSAAKEAQKIIFLVDSREGVHPVDTVIANMLRPFEDKVVLAINKVDEMSKRSVASEFYALGIPSFFPISSIHGTGIGDLLDAIVKDFDAQKNSPDLKKTHKIAFVGRPNVGKSSLMNAILKEERVIVDSVAGTTRDAIEAYYDDGQDRYVFVDTAGLRKKAKVEDGIEYYSVLRTQKAIHDADLVVLIIAADERIGEQDKKIITWIVNAGKSMVVFVNKWDLTSRTDMARTELIKSAHNAYPALTHYPFVFGSAKESIHLKQLFDIFPVVLENSTKRIKTPELNRFVETVIKRNPPPAKMGNRVKIFYATQAESNPPVFIFFVNQALSVGQSYIRFVEHRLREAFPFFEGVPIQIFFKSRSKVKLASKN